MYTFDFFPTGMHSKIVCGCQSILTTVSVSKNSPSSNVNTPLTGVGRSNKHTYHWVTGKITQSPVFTFYVHRIVIKQITDLLCDDDNGL